MAASADSKKDEWCRCVRVPVAWERAVPGPQGDVSEHALFSQRVQVGQDAVGVRELVEQRDVHGAGAGAGLAILVDGHRHCGFAWRLQGVARNNLSHCSMATRTGVKTMHA